MAEWTDTLVAELERVKNENRRLRDARQKHRANAALWRLRWRRDFGCKRVSLVCGCGRTVTGNPFSTRKSSGGTPNPLVGAGVPPEGA